MDLSKTSFAGWALEYEYSNASISNSKGVSQFFKGADKNVLSGIKRALEYDKKQYGKDRLYQLYVATANMHLTQSGDCGNGGYDR